MKRTCCTLALLGLALAPWAVSAQVHSAAPEAAAEPAPAPIPPDQQATRAQVDKLFEAMQIRKQMQMLLQMMPAMIDRQMNEQMKTVSARLPDQSQLTPEQQEHVKQIIHKYMEKALNAYPVDAMLSDMADIYQHHFTRADVDAYIAFYNAPAGQHLLAEQPTIMREYMPIVMERVQKSSQKLTEEMAREMEDYMHSIKPTAPAPAAPAAKAPAQSSVKP